MVTSLPSPLEILNCVPSPPRLHGSLKKGRTAGFQSFGAPALRSEARDQGPAFRIHEHLRAPGRERGAPRRGPGSWVWGALPGAEKPGAQTRSRHVKTRTGSPLARGRAASAAGAGRGSGRGAGRSGRGARWGGRGARRGGRGARRGGRGCRLQCGLQGRVAAVWLPGLHFKEHVLANPSSRCVMDFSASSLEFQTATRGASAARSV